MITVYTIQEAGVDITIRHPSLADYIEKRQAFALARYLGWDHWFWGYQELNAFESEPRSVEELARGTLWTLLLPKHEVKWCNPIALREGREPVWSWFRPSPEEIRKKGDFPLAFVKAPIQNAWVLRRGSGKDALIKGGLWQAKGGE